MRCGVTDGSSLQQRQATFGPSACNSDCLGSPRVALTTEGDARSEAINPTGEPTSNRKPPLTPTSREPTVSTPDSTDPLVAHRMPKSTEFATGNGTTWDGMTKGNTSSSAEMAREKTVTRTPASPFTSKELPAPARLPAPRPTAGIPYAGGMAVATAVAGAGSAAEACAAELLQAEGDFARAELGGSNRYKPLLPMRAEPLPNSHRFTLT